MRVSKSIEDTVRKSLSDLSHLYGPQSSLATQKPEFGDSVYNQLLVTHASAGSKVDEPLKKEARVVCEINVADVMLNGSGNIHGGCSAFLIDLCATLSLMVYERGMHVTQCLNVVYHSPATLGEKLRIVNTTIAVGTQVMSAKSEIWNATQHRLVASGVLVKLRPGGSKL
ncbi:HotDog domain-containing protein [Mycena vitilis]|nr:HotDog domain-containing protein [Mycena vitilis]